MGGRFSTAKEKLQQKLQLGDDTDGKTREALIEEGRRKLKMDVMNSFNFAVVGQKGVGKSSLINGLRGLRDNHQDAAPINETTTTIAIQKYGHPSYPHLVFWELPAPLSSTDAYFSNNMLYAFDCIIILSSDRFLPVDFDIARMAMEFHLPCAFVRTKADVAVESIAKSTGKLMLDASQHLRISVDESLRKGLEDVRFPSDISFRLFIVSAPRFTSKAATYSRYDAATGKQDESLKKMDEDQFLMFIVGSAKSRCKDVNNYASTIATLLRNLG